MQHHHGFRYSTPEDRTASKSFCNDVPIDLTGDDLHSPHAWVALNNDTSNRTIPKLETDDIYDFPSSDHDRVDVQGQRSLVCFSISAQSNHAISDFVFEDYHAEIWTALPRVHGPPSKICRSSSHDDSRNRHGCCAPN